MKWFRSHIKQGSRLALVALAIQFALSFGHFHGLAAQAAPAVQPDTASFELSYSNGLTAPDAVNEPAVQPAPDRDTGLQPDDPCAICAVIALAHSVLFTTPPILLLPDAIEFLYRTTDAEFVHLNSVHLAFQSRAPPIS